MLVSGWLRVCRSYVWLPSLDILIKGNGEKENMITDIHLQIQTIIDTSIHICCRHEFRGSTSNAAQCEFRAQLRSPLRTDAGQNSGSQWLALSVFQLSHTCIETTPPTATRCAQHLGCRLRTGSGNRSTGGGFGISVGLTK